MSFYINIVFYQKYLYTHYEEKDYFLKNIKNECREVNRLCGVLGVFDEGFRPELGCCVYSKRYHFHKLNEEIGEYLAVHHPDILTQTIMNNSDFFKQKLKEKYGNF